MKTNPLISAMLGVLTVGAVVTFALAIYFEIRVRELNKLQPQVIQAQAALNLVNAVADEAVRYSQHNGAIDPILRTVGAKPPLGAMPPAARPATR